jgi:LPXTG-motif cell wall-anchored protein
MKPKGLVLSVLGVLIITALSPAVAVAQNAGPSPAMNTANFDSGADPGTKQSSLFMPGQTNTTTKNQTLNPQKNQPRQKGAQDANNATPTGADPGTSNATDPVGKGSGNATTDPGGAPGQIKELPKTGGARVPILSIVGVMLVAGGLSVRKVLR